MSLAGAIADARKSAQRMYINNFADKGRQNTIDMLLVSTNRQFSPGIACLHVQRDGSWDKLLYICLIRSMTLWLVN